MLISTLIDEILKLTDPNHPSFVGWPQVLLPTGDVDPVGTQELVATNWSQAASAFYATLFNPVVTPATLALGAAAFKTTMFGLLAVPGGGAAALDAAFVAMTATFVASPPYVVTPPIGPPGVAAAMTPFLAGAPTPIAPATALAARIFTWSLTGTASIPPMPPAPWV